MYDFGEQFKIDMSKSKSENSNVIEGKFYRFTVLTEGLIRMEYNKNGEFLDEPTIAVSNRNFGKVNFNTRGDDKFLEISTSKFRLMYSKEKPFLGSRVNPMGNLTVTPAGKEKVWYYNHPEALNIGGPGKDYKKTSKGLYSEEGFATFDDSKSLIFLENGAVKNPIEGHIDIYLFIYNDFQEALNDYYKLTSYPALLPRYALGNFWSRNVNYNYEELEELLDNFKYNEVPLSAISLNKSWHINEFEGKETNSGYAFNSEKFASPVNLINLAHKDGLRLGLSISSEAIMYPYEPQYEKAKNFLKTEDNKPIPLSVYDPKMLDVYFKLLIHPLDNLGVDFFVLEGDKKQKNIDLFLMAHYHFKDMQRDYKRRPMVITDNHGITTHKYPIIYGGKTIVSWDTLKNMPYYYSLISNVGSAYYAHDIGGYHKGIEDNELYIRYAQLGVFSPILKFGSEKGKYYKREPWLWSIKTYTIVKDYLNLRHKLLPYLYTEAYNFYKTGKPIIKPLYHDYKEYIHDPNYKNEYFFGSSLFISPIINKKEYLLDRVIHRFYMPDGIWYDFFTGKKFPGNRHYISFFKDQEYPVFARQGAIIPMGTNKNINDTNPPKDMEIHIFPGKSNSYLMYEDDGVSDLYKKGYFLSTMIDYNHLDSNYTVIIRAVEGKSNIVPNERNYQIRFRNTKNADEVTAYFNGNKIPSTSYVDGQDFIVEVKDVKTIGQLTINCKGKDIEIDAVRIMNDDIQTIISDLQIQTELKEKLDNVLFSDLPINKKRIEIRKLKRHGLESKFIKVFLKLLEYIKNI